MLSDQLPLKQGLKLKEATIKAASSVALRPTSIKTRIETRKFFILSVDYHSLRPTSIKTRIETQILCV